MLAVARDRLRAALDDAGVPATSDPATLNPPGVLVGPVVRVAPDDATGCDLYVTVPVFVVVPAPADDRAQDVALPLLDAVLDAVGVVSELDDATFVPFDHKGSTLPAYSVTVRLLA